MRDLKTRSQKKKLKLGENLKSWKKIKFCYLVLGHKIVEMLKNRKKPHHTNQNKTKKETRPTDKEAVRYRFSNSFV